MSTASARISNNARRLQARLRGLTGKAIEDFRMIEAGDRVMVCLSGGKDSYTLLDLLLTLRRSAPVDFELVAVNLDQKQPGFPEHVLPDYLRSLDVPFHVLEHDTYSVVSRVIPEGKTLCGLCSRLRRGALYTFAAQEGFTVIRPLAYCRERDVGRYAHAREFPIIPCNLCGSQENLQRKEVKKMLRRWEAENPNRVDSILAGLKNVVPSHLMDADLFDFGGLTRETPSD
jgi:tRNA 2-thiocytidine biosynthesis protein TtcA